MPAEYVRRHQETRPWALISIASPGDEHLRPANSDPAQIARLDLTFDNVERVSRGDIAFCGATADTVVDFFLTHRNTAHAWVIHCSMGSARSPAIAAVLDLILSGQDEVWWTKREPNRRVYECMVRAAEDHHLIPDGLSYRSLVRQSRERARR